jgi:hypothetical protein
MDKQKETTGTEVTRRIISRKEFKNKKDVVIEWVDLSEFFGDGAGLFVRTISAKERDRYERSLFNTDGDGVGKGKISLENARAKLLTHSVCDENGNLIFLDDDAEWLGEKSSRMVQIIVDKIQEINKMGDTELKETIKNLPETGKEDSISG